MFTVRSVSEEGTYYLVNHWQKNKAFWKLPSEIRHEEMFKRAGDAKGSLTKLLKVMDDYKDDIFHLIETNDEDKIVNITPIIIRKEEI